MMIKNLSITSKFDVRFARAAALCLFAFAAAVLAPAEARAQWTTTGTNTTTTNNVGVGTTAPAASVHVSTAAAGTTRGIIDEQTSADSNSALFMFRKSRAGAAAQMGDNVGSLFAQPFDGVNFLNSARVRFSIDGPVTAGSAPTNIQFLTGANADGIERMRITSTGNVGIGTSNPAYHLHISNDLNSEVFETVENVNAGATAAASILAKTNNGYAYLKMGSTAYGSWAAVGTTGTGSFYYDVFNPTGDHVWRTTSAATERMRITSAGRVGIATTTPLAPLHVSTGGPSGGVAFFQKDSASNGVGIGTTNGVGAISGVNSNYTTTTDLLVNPYGGKVGIGTTAPATALHVVGDVTVTGNINAKWQDVAEWVPTTQKLQPGTVVVLDTSRDNHVAASLKAYDTRVAGVVSAQPGIALGEAGEGKALVATTGRVKVMVDATHAPIQIGDLIVTSDTSGVAMKSVPVEFGGVEMHRPGTIIGKALESLEKGTGEILVLLSLQ